MSAGQQPQSAALRSILARELNKRARETEYAVLHHFSDLPDRLQLEVEYVDKSKPLLQRCRFERVVFSSLGTRLWKST